MSDRLVAALLEIERHVAKLGWDQPPRLFALVPTAELLETEPQLLAHLGPADSLTSIEQDEFHAGADLAASLARITWPAPVAGCALAVERSFLPPEAEASLPADPAAAASAVAGHPSRLDLRVVVGVTRDGAHHGLARMKAGEGELLGGADLVPALCDALAHTFEEVIESVPREGSHGSQGN